MYPDACLKELREAIKALDMCGSMDASVVYNLAEEVKCKFESLDSWLKSGGLLPNDWWRVS